MILEYLSEISKNENKFKTAKALIKRIINIKRNIVTKNLLNNLLIEKSLLKISKIFLKLIFKFLKVQ